MTEHYVTLFDSTFLAQGLALHASMARHAGEFDLTVIAMDETVERVLEDMALSRVRVVPLREAETDELHRVKPSRSIAEYCWTITPFAAEVVPSSRQRPPLPVEGTALFAFVAKRLAVGAWGLESRGGADAAPGHLWR